MTARKTKRRKNPNDHLSRARAEAAAWYAQQSDRRLWSLYQGAWDANDRDGALYAKTEMVRRGMDVSRIPWPSLD